MFRKSQWQLIRTGLLFEQVYTPTVQQAADLLTKAPTQRKLEIRQQLLGPVQFLPPYSGKNESGAVEKWKLFNV